MRKTLLILPLLFWSAGAAGLTDDETIGRIYQHISQLEEKYPNIRIRRTMTVRELDPDSGKVRKTSVSEQDVLAHVGERPQIKILSCTVNGASAKPEACERKERDRKPPLRIFGPTGHQHYRFELLPQQLGGDAPFYRLRVIPKQKTERHFEGVLEFTASDLSLHSSHGTIAAFPMAMKKMELELFFDDLDGRSVPSRTRMDMTLYLPLVLNSRVISESVTSESRIPAD